MASGGPGRTERRRWVGGLVVANLGVLLFAVASGGRLPWLADDGYRLTVREFAGRFSDESGFGLSSWHTGGGWFLTLAFLTAVVTWTVASPPLAGRRRLRTLAPLVLPLALVLLIGWDMIAGDRHSAGDLRAAYYWSVVAVVVVAAGCELLRRASSSRPPLDRDALMMANGGLLLLVATTALLPWHLGSTLREHRGTFSASDGFGLSRWYAGTGWFLSWGLIMACITWATAHEKVADGAKADARSRWVLAILVIPTVLMVLVGRDIVAGASAHTFSDLGMGFWLSLLTLAVIIASVARLLQPVPAPGTGTSADAGAGRHVVTGYRITEDSQLPTGSTESKPTERPTTGG